MKRVLPLVLALVAPCGGVQVHAAESAFQMGISRDAYAEQAGQELRQVRSQVDQTARRSPDSAQGRFASVYDSLADAEQALVELKSAEGVGIAERRKHFDELRSKALQRWREFRLTSDDSAVPKG